MAEGVLHPIEEDGVYLWGAEKGGDARLLAEALVDAALEVELFLGGCIAGERAFDDGTVGDEVNGS